MAKGLPTEVESGQEKATVIQIQPQDIVPQLGILKEVPANPGLFSAENLKLIFGKTGLTIELASGVICQMNVKSDKQGKELAFCVNRHLFSTFVGFGEGSKVPFTLKMGQGVLRVTQGRRLIDLPIMKPESAYAGKVFAERTEAVELDGQTVRTVASFASVQASEPAYGCVFSHKGHVYGFNGVSGVRVKTKAKAEKVVIPLLLARLWGGLKGAEFGVSDAVAVVKTEGVKLAQTTYLPAKEEFPYQKIDAQFVEHKSGGRVRFVSGSLYGLSERFSTYVRPGSEADRYLRVLFSGQEAVFTVKLFGAQVTERAKLVQAEGMGQEQSYLLGLDYFMPFVQAAQEQSAKEIEMRIADGRPYVFSAGEIEFVLARATGEA